MTLGLSLRARLTLLILTPLICIAAIVGGWAYIDAQDTAAERFDRSLLSTALAISRDIAVNGGDALSEETRDLLRDTSGGAVFYHVYAPDGVFVTGFATPPVPPRDLDLLSAQIYYDANYRRTPIRALRFAQQASIDGLSGLFTFTVWQEKAVLNGFVRSRTTPVFAIIASMIGAVAFIVWFGVSWGLAPLTSLEDAIARRSVEDLSPIKRRIPQEVSGIVGQFNNLLAELSASFAAKDAFISDVAHQLRNPIAGVIALTDAVASARDADQAKHRLADLRAAARDVGHLANSLLTLERLRASPSKAERTPFDAIAVLGGVVSSIMAAAETKGVHFEARFTDGLCFLEGDAVMFEQAVLNLLNNALVHGGSRLSVLRLDATCQATCLQVRVEDNGKGIEPKDFDKARARFSQVSPSLGSGLGIPIADAVVQNHGGRMWFERTEELFVVALELPLATRSSAESEGVVSS